MGLLDRAALDVLAHGAYVGILEAVLVPVSAHDPFLRPAIRRRVEAALERARAKTKRDDAEHLLRLAFVLAHPDAPRDLAADDEKAVLELFDKLAAPFVPRAKGAPTAAAGAYREAAAERAPVQEEETPRPRRRRFWPATTAVGLLVASGAALAVAAAIVPSLVPTAKERFQKTALGAALGDDLSTVVANAGPSGDAAAVDAAMARLTSPAVKRQAGDDAVLRMVEALDAVPAVTGSPLDDVDEAAAPVFRAVNQANEALRARRVPALLHAYASGSAGKYRVWLTSYFVERRTGLQVGGLSVDVAWGRRLDYLNLADSQLYKGAHEGWVVLSRDSVDEELVEGILPALADGGALPLDAPREPSDPRPPKATMAGLAAGRAVRAELPIATADAKALVEAIAARNVALVALQEARYVAAPTWRIDLPPSRERSFKNAVEDGGAFKRLASAALSAQTRVKVAARPLEPTIVRLSLLREEQFASRLEEEKHRRVGAVPGEDVRSISVACADLATVARAQDTPALALYLLVRRAHASRSLVEARAAREALASFVLAVAERAPPGSRSAHLDDDTLARAFEETDGRIQAAGRRAYEVHCGRGTPAFSRSAE
ncbi:MAG: hypothetical protein KC657_34240 [Myxococcales bacterium]|nr:hypothetical protein [Myxococcales bacterium]